VSDNGEKKPDGKAKGDDNKDNDQHPPGGEE
jgi:hypothetical protein